MQKFLVASVKCHQLQRALPTWPPDQGLCPWTHRGTAPRSPLWPSTLVPEFVCGLTFNKLCTPGLFGIIFHTLPPVYESEAHIPLTSTPVETVAQKWLLIIVISSVHHTCCIFWHPGHGFSSWNDLQRSLNVIRYDTVWQIRTVYLLAFHSKQVPVLHQMWARIFHSPPLFNILSINGT